MEAQTDIQTYLEQGKQALAMGQGREAAIAYAHSAQIDPNNPLVHLGLAEANLALANYGVVQMACRRVQELQPEGGNESRLSQALLDLLERRYERALQQVDAVIQDDPGIAYAHALRSYLLRATGQDYDANLARARATRLSYGGRFENCFPQIEPRRVNDTPAAAAEKTSVPPPQAEPAQQQQAWAPPNAMRRQLIRTRFALSRYPFLITNILIGINVLVYLLMVLYFKTISFSPEQAYNAGAQVSPLIQETGEYWRIFTAMFIHFNIYHIGLNMLSLFFIGRAAEMFYGKWRYLLIYLGSGVLGGLLTFFTQGDQLIVSAGASGAIFGVFGAIGLFYLVNRRALGAYGRSAIGNWVFWLALNLVWGFGTPGIGIIDHIGGLIAGMLLAFLLMPRSRRGRPGL